MPGVELKLGASLTKLHAAMRSVRRTLLRTGLAGARALKRTLGAGARAVFRGIRMGAMLAGRAIRRMTMGLAIGGLGALATAAIVLTRVFRGLKNAIDLGSQLSDLASQTGMSAGQVMILRQAFEDSGVSAEKMGPAVNKLQRSIVEAGEGITTYQRAFGALGLSWRELLELSPADQFRTVAQAIAALPDPTERAARAMQIFGRSGGELQALFDNPAALEKAAQTVGKQAGIMDRAAARFDRVSDLLKSAGTKLRGFFVGLAEGVIPALQQILEEFNNVDWSGIGKRIGDALMRAYAVIKDGRGIALFQSGMKVAVTVAMDLLMRGLRSAVAFLATALPPIFAMLGAKLKDPLFWEGLKNVGKAIGAEIAAAISSAYGNRQASADYRHASGQYMTAAGKQITAAGEGQNPAAVIGTSLKAGAAAAKDAFGEMGKAARDSIGEFKELLRSGDAAVQRIREATETTAAPSMRPAGTVGDAAAAGGSATTIASSMARIGGGGFGTMIFQPLVREAQKQTSIQTGLKTSVDRIANRSTVSVYA